MNFGERIKTLRKAAGLRQEDLGTPFGWGKSHCSRLENGWLPSMRCLSVFADMFGLTVQELLEPVEFSSAPKRRRRA